MAKSKKRSKKVDTKEAENSGSTVTDTKKGEIASVSVSTNETKPYEPGFLSSMLAEKKIESNPEYEVESDEEEIEVNSEEEKSWNPFDDDSMDENVSKAFEELQKNPDKWMKEMEKRMDESGSEETSESEEESVEEDGSGEEEEESGEEEMEENVEEEKSEQSEEQENASEEESMSEEELERQKKREQLQKLESEEKDMSKSIDPNLSVLVKGISFDYQEDSFRDVFKNCGEIKLLYIVHRNNGRCAGYGAIQFANQKGRKAALKLDGASYLGRNMSISKLEDPSVLDRQSRRKERKHNKNNEKKEKEEKKEETKKTVTTSRKASKINKRKK